VTLHHPHGQIYAYPFVPPVPARMWECEQAYYRNQRGLLQDLIQRATTTSVLYQDERDRLRVPICARYPTRGCPDSSRLPHL